jgi:hypothetical protein
MSEVLAPSLFEPVLVAVLALSRPKKSTTASLRCKYKMRPQDTPTSLRRFPSALRIERWQMLSGYHAKSSDPETRNQPTLAPTILISLSIWQTGDVRHRANFDCPNARPRDSSGNPHGLFEILSLDQEIPSDLFSRFGKWAVRY